MGSHNNLLAEQSARRGQHNLVSSIVKRRPERGLRAESKGVPPRRDNRPATADQDGIPVSLRRKAPRQNVRSFSYGLRSEG